MHGDEVQRWNSSWVLRNYSLFFLTLDSGDAQCPLWEEAGKSHIIPSGSGRQRYEFHLVLSVPLPRPCLSSSLTCWQQGLLEIRGRCVLAQCIAPHLATGKTIWRQRDNGEWWAADGVSLHIKHVLIRRAVCAHCQQQYKCDKNGDEQSDRASRGARPVQKLLSVHLEEECFQSVKHQLVLSTHADQVVHLNSLVMTRWWHHCAD